MFHFTLNPHPVVHHVNEPSVRHDDVVEADFSAEALGQLLLMEISQRSYRSEISVLRDICVCKIVSLTVN